MKTNLQDISENFEDIKEKSTNFGVCELCHIHKYGSNCIGKYCFECEFKNEQSENTLEYLNKERTSKIKLSPFEYDLLKSYSDKPMSFNCCSTLMNMKDKGYFKNVIPEWTLSKILRYSVVVGVDMGGDRDAK